MTGRPVRPPAYQLLADEIRIQITSGRLRPGERLPPEPELCIRSGVSRSTVREALRLLASQHLIVTTRGVTGGSFVAHPDPHRLADSLSTGLALLSRSPQVCFADLLELRRALEVPAAALAAARHTADHLTVLQAAAREPYGEDVPAMLRTHAAFHTAVAAATGNPLFELVTRPLYEQHYERGFFDHVPDGYWGRIAADHEDLVRCLAARDADAATAVSHRHLDLIATATGGRERTGADRPVDDLRPLARSG